MKKLVPLLVLLLVLGSWMIWPETGETHVTTTNTVLFDREVVAILDRHCVACHAAESMADPLETYEEVWLSRAPVLASVLDQHMPPWAAVPGYGDFANDNGLTLRETHFLVSWVEGLGPRNDGAVFLNVRDAGDAPAVVRADPGFDTWVLGEPDRLLRLDPTVVEPGQGERIERKVVDLGLGSETWIRGLEFRPGDRRVVRAASFTLESTGQWLGSWTPWHGFVELPEDAAYRLPAGSRVVAEVYYGTSDEPVSDAAMLGLFLSDNGGAMGVPTDLVLETRGEVAAGSTTTRFEARTVIQADSRAWALRPQFEPGIESLEVSVRTPDGGTRVLLFAKDIPFGWPTPYIFAEPVPLGAGSELRAVAYHANPESAPEPGGFRLTVSLY